MVVRFDGLQLGPSGYCFFCGQSLRKYKGLGRQPFPKNSYTRDHLIPRSKGGGYYDTVSACLGCNQDKKDLTLDEYRVVRAFRAGLLPVPDYRFAAETRV